ncbi:MAG: hypothetical protein E6R13_07555 [Spirochaetes bacterium]|nr:MAG: hypothetical protein E6R13_07555 [Spirochaetota bacterium]
MKAGDKVTMLFHSMGMVSQEELTIIEINETEIVTSETFGSNDEYRKFSRKTGKCLNDTTTFGSYRTLKVN